MSDFKKNIKIVVTIIGIVVYMVAHGKSSNTDSLIKLINANAKASNFKFVDTLTLHAITHINKYYFENGMADSMQYYASLGLNLINNLKSTTFNEEEVTALDTYEMLLNKQMGVSYSDNGDYVNQFKYFKQYLLTAQKLGKVNDIATAYVYMATCQRELEDTAQLMIYAKQAIQTLGFNKFPITLAKAYTLLGNYYFDTGTNDDSVYYYRNKVYTIFKEVEHNYFLVSAALDLTEYFLYKGQTDSAKHYLKQIDRIVEVEKNSEHQMMFYTYKAQVRLLDGNDEEAIKLLQKAKALANETNEVNDNSQINRILALALAANGNTQQAVFALNEAINQYSEDLNTEKVRSLTKAQMNFDFEKERVINALEIKRKQQFQYFLLALVVLLLVLAGFIFQRYRDKKRTNDILNMKNHAIEQAFLKLKETQHDLVETEKQREAQSVRIKIARDIHDEIGSGLTKITLLSDVAKRKSNTAEIADAFLKITLYSKAVSAALSEIVWSINPGNDNMQSMITYMKAAANTLLEDSGVNFTLNFHNGTETNEVHPEIKRNVFLVMKEGLNNAIKYSQAKNINVVFEVRQNQFKLLIQDDGKGFDFACFKVNNTGNGLKNMHNRMLQHNNSLQIIAASGNGCIIVAEGSLV